MQESCNNLKKHYSGDRLKPFNCMWSEDIVLAIVNKAVTIGLAILVVLFNVVSSYCLSCGYLQEAR